MYCRITLEKSFAPCPSTNALVDCCAARPASPGGGPPWRIGDEGQVLQHQVGARSRRCRPAGPARFQHAPKRVEVSLDAHATFGCSRSRRTPWVHASLARGHALEVAIISIASIMLLQILATWPLPEAPQCTTFLAHGGAPLGDSCRDIAAAMKVRVPAPARRRRENRRIDHRACLASLPSHPRAVSGSMVEQSMRPCR